MRFGLVGFPLGQMGASVDAAPHDALIAIARAADELGFDFVCAQDHILAPREWAGERGGETWFDPFVVLSAVAAVTQRVRVVTDVIVLPYRSPFATAKAAASLDVLSNGRLTLGVAAGYLEREFRVLGAEFEQRGAWTDEAIEIVKQCWAEEWLSVSGLFTQAEDVAVSPQPLQQPRPPIWVGGNSMRALRRAVEHGDGWTPFRGEADHIAQAMQRARDEFGLDRPLDVAVPLRRGVYAGDHIDSGSVRHQADALALAGVTHCKVGFRGGTLDGYLAAMEQFSTGVIHA